MVFRNNWDLILDLKFENYNSLHINRHKHYEHDYRFKPYDFCAIFGVSTRSTTWLVFVNFFTYK